ncbi:hypothetical protein GCM10027610_123510 [Dactylosporangium cerinum]
MTAHFRVRGDVAVLVPAAGMGVRLGPGAPKALRLLRGEPLLVHAVRRVALAPSVGCIVVAAPADAVDDVTVLLSSIVAGETCVAAEPALVTSGAFDGSVALDGSGALDGAGASGGFGAAPGVRLIVVAGGASRQASVAAALAAVPDEFGIVLVHDAARALTPPELVEAVADAVRGGTARSYPFLRWSTP